MDRRYRGSPFSFAIERDDNEREEAERRADGAHVCVRPQQLLSVENPAMMNHAQNESTQPSQEIDLHMT